MRDTARTKLPITAFWPGTGIPRSLNNAFTAAPRAVPQTVNERARVAAAHTNAKRSAKQILADAKNGIAIGKPADSHKRARLRRAAI